MCGSFLIRRHPRSYLFQLLLSEEYDCGGLVGPDLLTLVQVPDPRQCEVLEGSAVWERGDQHQPLRGLVHHHGLAPHHPQLGVLPVLVQGGLAHRVGQQVLPSLRHLVVDVESHDDGLGLQGPGGDHHHVIPVDGDFVRDTLDPLLYLVLEDRLVLSRKYE